MQRPDLEVDRIREALSSRYPRIDVVATTGSTNADLLADLAAPDRSVLVAETQTAGRGRLDRNWMSPPKASLLLSVLLRPSVPIPSWGWVPLLTGVAVAQSLAAAGVDGVCLKWPNDVLVRPGDRKISGILAQTQALTSPDHDPAVVIGIGINVSTDAEELADMAVPNPPAGGSLAGTSLVLAGIENPDRTALLVDVLTRLDHQVARWEDVDGDAEACGLANDYRELCATLGRDVAVYGLDGSEVFGAARDVDASGHLLVQVEGQIRIIAAGDVRHARPLR
jgi:BirA family biotin operon repressor/biotin-[acetyl-CoA-carboxylase] ligase